MASAQATTADERSTVIDRLSARGKRSREEASILFDALVDKPNPTLPWTTVDAGMAAIMIDNGRLLDASSRHGWLKPDGAMLRCSPLAHDRLLHCLGVETGAAEAAGWARVTEAGVRSVHRLTQEQRKTLARLRIAYDPEDDRLKPPLGQAGAMTGYAERVMAGPEARHRHAS